MTIFSLFTLSGGLAFFLYGMNRWITHMLGKIPEKGDSFRCQGYKITVISVSRHRVEQVLFQKD